MWTTSSSPGDPGTAWVRFAVLVAVAVGALAGAPTPVSAQVATTRVPPDAPRIRAPQEARPQAVNQDWRQPVEIEVVRVLTMDSTLNALAGPGFVRAASDALAIEVQAVRAFDITPRSSWPVVVLNGQPIRDSRVSPASPDVIYGFLPDRERIGARNTVEVYWVGNEELTRTRAPTVFTRDQVPPPGP